MWTHAPPQLVLHATDCAITRNHTEILCTMGPGVGGHLQWTVVIAGQTSAIPLTSYRPPTLSSLGWVPPGGSSVLDSPALAQLDSRGQGQLLFQGDYFANLGLVATGRQEQANGTAIVHIPPCPPRV